MTDMNPTYATEDGVTYAIVAGKVIASGADFDEVERDVREVFASDLMTQVIQTLGSRTAKTIKQALTAKDFRMIADAIRTAPGATPELAQHFAEYLAHTNPAFDAERFLAAAGGAPTTGRDVFHGPGGTAPGGTLAKTATAKTATHITTPNGIKGQILSRTAGLWSDEVTVRFDNGQIHSVAVTDRLEFSTEQHKTASAKPVDQLRAEIAKSKVGGVASRKTLTDRIIDLGRAKDEAHMIIAGGVSYDDARELHEIVLHADYEVSELKQAVDHIDSTEGEGYVPFKPEQQILDGESVGHKNDGTWLDATLNDMIAEADDTDFDSVLDDGPTLMVSEQDDAAIADGGTIREKALSFVRNKTAGLSDANLAEKYENAFVARCEDARRVELAHRKAVTKKEAATKKSTVDDAPVESLFL